jgi:hypothetical protein
MRSIIAFIVTLAILAAGILGWRQIQPGANSADGPWPPPRAVTGSEIAARPEAKLLYPGAEVLYRPLSNEQTSGFGLSFAAAEVDFLTKATPDKVFAWYKARLLALGWSLGDLGRGNIPEKSFVQYKRGTRETFRIGIQDPRLLGVFLGGKWPTDRTIVFVRYTVMPFSAAK